MGYPREWSKITVKPEGEVEVAIGTLSSGQGHETSFAQCVSEWLAVPFEQVKLVQGDTDIVPVGGGSHSGRSMRFACDRHGHLLQRDHRARQAHRRAHAGDRSRQGRVQGRPLPQRHVAALVRRVRDRARGADAQRSRRRPARAACGRERPAFHRRRLSLRLRRLRGRDRARHRRGRDRALFRGRRRRPRGQSDDPARPDPRRASRKASARRCGSIALSIPTAGR